jgi:bifunctional enzyme CysN/CysC
MSWWTGKTFLDLLDDFVKEKPLDNLPFRLPVQDVYKFTKYKDSRRIIAGSISTGILKPGDELVFYPSGKRSKIRAIETFNGPEPEEVASGNAVGFTLTEQIYVKRGDLVARQGDKPPQSGTVLRVNLFWLGRKPLEMGKEYYLKVGTDKVRMQLFDTIRVIDASSLNTDSMKKKIERHDVADCVLTTQRAIAFDIVEDLPQTSRFVIVDDYEIAGGGIIREVIKDTQAESRESVFTRNYEWDTSVISREERTKRYNHKPAIILISGEADSDKKEFAKELEKEFFKKNINVYYMGISNVLYGMDADLGSSGRKLKANNRFREEHLRRMAEMAHIMLDAGMVLIVTASDLTFDEKEMIKLRVKPAAMRTIWYGDEITTNVDVDYQITEDTPEVRGNIRREIFKKIEKKK